MSERGKQIKCPHSKGTKKKLVSWATVTKGQHEQGFKNANCCVVCGKEIKG